MKGISNEIYVIIGFVSAIVGIISFLWYLYEKKFPFRKLSWRFAEKMAQKIADSMIKDDFSPTLIVGIGRGGAILGAMISGCLGHRSLLVIDREYEWKEMGRVEDIIFFADVPAPFLNRVLLVAGEIHSGATMKSYYNYFSTLGAREIKKAVLFFEEGCPVTVEYIGIKSSKKNILMPWMFSKNYMRADRKPPKPIIIKEKSILILYLVRHGRTMYDDEDRFCGVSDPDLTEVGIEQAISLGKIFRGVKIEHIYTSERRRAVETAKIIHALNPNAEIIIDKNLNEMNFGKWEGLAHNKIKETFPEEYAKWETDPINNHIPDGDNPNNILGRMLEFLRMLEKKWERGRNKHIVCISHKTPIRLLLCHFGGLHLSLYRQYDVYNGTFIKLVYDGERWSVERDVQKKSSRELES